MSDLCKCGNKLCETVQSPCLQGRGPKPADIMFIGEGPGPQEDIYGQVFIGPVGRFLSKYVLSPAGIIEKEVYLANAMGCFPNKDGKVRSPSRAEVLTCRSRLMAEIKTVKPKVCVLMGNAALMSAVFLDKMKGITEWRGNGMWSREWNCWVMPTLHPSALRRDSQMGKTWMLETCLGDIQEAEKMVRRAPPVLDLPKVKWLRNGQDVWRYLTKALESGTVVVDLETDLFHPTNEILGVAMCYRDRRGYHPVYFQWQYAEDNSLFQKLMVDGYVTKIFHNIAYDQRFLHHHGVGLRGPLHDTMIMANHIDENFPINLKDLVWRYLGFGGYDIPLELHKIENKFTKKDSYKKFPVEVLAPYAAKDGYATYKLFEFLKPRLREQNQVSLYKRISMPVRQVMTEAEIHGIYVDLDGTKALMERCKLSQVVLEEKIKQLAKNDELNVRSNPQLGKLLFEQIGVPNQGLTKTGQYSVTEKVLSAVYEDGVDRTRGKYKKASLICEHLLNIRKLGKMMSTYLKPILSNVWPDGRIRSTFDTVKAKTGRTSNKNPCTHNIPQDRLIRSLYMAEPPNVFVEADLKGAELRGIAAESGEPTFLEAFAKNIDIHDQTYRVVFNKSSTYKVGQEERRTAKMINFGLLYGMTYVGLAKRLGISLDEAQEILEQYFAKLPRIKQWLDETVKKARKQGYVESLLKRRRRLPNINSDDRQERQYAERQAQNAPIQSVAADITYLGLIKLSIAIKEHSLEAKIVHTVHDCVIVECPRSEVTLVKKLIKAAFETPIRAVPVNMKVEIEVSRRWGEHNESALEEILADESAARHREVA